jgi:hypothetical protein
MNYVDIIAQALKIQTPERKRVVTALKPLLNRAKPLPRSRGGTNTLDNMVICDYHVNLAKNTLSKGEFVALCQAVVKHCI